jgi:hypothetical protein
VSTTTTPDRFTTLPDEPTLASAVTALEEHGFSAEVVKDPSCAWGAANVIFVVSAQKLVPTLEAAHERIYQHSLVLEDARAIAAYGQHSSVGKILEIHQELPGRIHVVLIRQVAGF